MYYKFDKHKEKLAVMRFALEMVAVCILEWTADYSVLYKPTIRRIEYLYNTHSGPYKKKTESEFLGTCKRITRYELLSFCCRVSVRFLCFYGFHCIWLWWSRHQPSNKKKMKISLSSWYDWTWLRFGGVVAAAATLICWWHRCLLLL